MKQPQGNANLVASFPVQLLTAGTSACIADLCTFPLDTAKVRLQVIYLLPDKNAWTLCLPFQYEITVSKGLSWSQFGRRSWSNLTIIDRFKAKVDWLPKCYQRPLLRSPVQTVPLWRAPKSQPQQHRRIGDWWEPCPLLLNKKDPGENNTQW